MVAFVITLPSWDPSIWSLCSESLEPTVPTIELKQTVIFSPGDVENNRNTIELDIAVCSVNIFNQTIAD